VWNKHHRERGDGIPDLPLRLPGVEGNVPLLKARDGVDPQVSIRSVLPLDVNGDGDDEILQHVGVELPTDGEDCEATGTVAWNTSVIDGPEYCNTDNQDVVVVLHGLPRP